MYIYIYIYTTRKQIARTNVAKNVCFCVFFDAPVFETGQIILPKTHVNKLQNQKLQKAFVLLQLCSSRMLYGKSLFFLSFSIVNDQEHASCKSACKVVKKQLYFMCFLCMYILRAPGRISPNAFSTKAPTKKLQKKIIFIVLFEPYLSRAGPFATPKALSI